jgi:hypothetical protein
MGSGTFLEEFKQDIEFTPVDNRANAYLIHPRSVPGRENSPASEMTEKDWDKFERDIADAFEQIP